MDVKQFVILAFTIGYYILIPIAFSGVYLLFQQNKVMEQRAFPNCHAFCIGKGYLGVEVLEVTGSNILCTCDSDVYNATTYYYNNYSLVNEQAKNNISFWFN